MPSTVSCIRATSLPARRRRSRRRPTFELQRSALKPARRASLVFSTTVISLRRDAAKRYFRYPASRRGDTSAQHNSCRARFRRLRTDVLLLVQSPPVHRVCTRGLRGQRQPIGPPGQHHDRANIAVACRSMNQRTAQHEGSGSVPYTTSTDRPARGHCSQPTAGPVPLPGRRGCLDRSRRSTGGEPRSSSTIDKIYFRPDPRRSVSPIRRLLEAGLWRYSLLGSIRAIASNLPAA